MKTNTKMVHFSKFIVFFIFVAGLGCFVTNCKTTQISDNKSTFTILHNDDEWALGPEADDTPRFLVFLELVRVNIDGKLEGRLAERWEHSDDHKIWTIHLRKNLKWHDGMPVTAYDIKFTIDLWNHPDVQYYHGAWYESVAVIDEFTCVITFRRAPPWESYWLPGYWSVFYPKHLLEDLDPKEFYRWEFWKNPVGNGPFLYVRHTPKTMMEFEANPDFYLGKPKIDRIILKFGQSSLTELLSGNVDAINHVRPREGVVKLIKDSRFDVHYAMWDDVSFPMVILWNQKNPLFQEKIVRQALTSAVDRNAILQLVNLPENMPIIDTIYTYGQYFDRELPEPYPYNPKLARNLLRKAGWVDNNGDGILEKNDFDFHFSLLTRTSSQVVAVLVQSDLRKVGVKVDLLNLEDQLLNQRLKSGDFDSLIRYISVYPSGSENTLIRYLGENSIINFENEKVFRLIKEADSTMVPDELRTIYRQLQPIIQENQPWTYLYMGVEPYAVNKRVRGLRTPFFANPIWRAEHLWIEE